LSFDVENFEKGLDDFPSLLCIRLLVDVAVNQKGDVDGKQLDGNG
jgi:hypothetical protein